MFKIGDLVTYKPDAEIRYNITNRDMPVGKVVDINYRTGNIEIELIDHRYKDEIGGKYWVNPKSFIKIPPESEIILETDYRGLETKSDKEISLNTTAEMILIADKK